MDEILAAIPGTGGVEISKKYLIFDFIHPPSQRGDASKTFSRNLTQLLNLIIFHILTHYITKRIYREINIDCPLSQNFLF